MVDYNSFAKTFAESRKDMKWQEIDYFLSDLSLDKKSILDIWCGSWRLLESLKQKSSDFDYLWLDLSEELLKIAKENNPEKTFENLNMLDINKVERGFDFVFFIASFHHLWKTEERLEVLSKAKKLLKKWWKIFMTNWALNSSVNNEKYKKSIVEKSENEFWWADYQIKISSNFRYYHCFSIEELEYLFKKSNFNIIENRLFENEKNYISIID